MVTYAGGIEQAGDTIDLRSPSSFTYHCLSGGSDPTIHASGQCNVVFPSGDPLGTYVLAWKWTGPDSRSAPCASNLTFVPAAGGNPPECDMQINVTS